MSDDTKAAADPVEALRAEATARLAALDAKKGGEAAPKTAQSDPVPPAPEATADKASDATEAKSPEAAPKAVDVEWLPENLRSKAAALDPELLTYLKPNVMRRGEHSRAMKALEAEREQIKAIKEKAGLWERLEANPEVAAAAYRMLNGEAAPAADPVEEEVPDPVLDPKGYAKWVVAQARAEVAPVAAKVVEERVTKPVSEEAAIKATAREWVEDNHITDAETLNAVIDEANTLAKEIGVRITTENVAALLTRAHKSLGKAAPAPKSGSEGGGLLKVASPAGRGSTSVAPVGVPAHVRENRQPQTMDEKVAHAAYLARERLGKKVSTEDIRALFGHRGVAAS